MRVGIVLVALLLLSGCNQRLSALPDAYHGQWDLTEALCANGDGVSRLVIGPRRLTYYEDVAVLAGPVERDKDRVSARFDLDGSDDQMDGRDPPKGVLMALELNGYGNGLAVTMSGKTENYVRCPRRAGQA